MKSFDIKPKQLKRPELRSKPRPVFVERPKGPVLERPARAWPKYVVGIIILLILSAYFLSFYILPEARIEVQARTEPVTRDFEIRVDKNLAEPNFGELAVPGKILEEEVADSKQYGATGTKNVGLKASGFVHIYNFTKTPLILKAATTVLSSGGRQYFFTQDVSGIRPTALIGLEDQEVDESSLVPPVPVAAALAGTEYNLPKGARLEIQNEVLGQNPKTLYAVVAEDISGGTTKEVKVVTEADIAAAHQSLYNELISQAKQFFFTKYGATALDNAMAADVLEPNASAAAGAEVQEFQVSVKVRVRAFVFNEEDVKSIVIGRIKRLLPENKVLEEGEGSRFGAQFANVSVQEGLGILVAHYEGRIVYQVKSEELVSRVRGKNLEEIREVLLSRPEIESAKIKFYPFWVKRAPKLAGKIRLEIGHE